MQFIHRISEIRYVIRHSELQTDALGFPKQPTPPVVAQFHKHHFDSELAEQQGHWEQLSPTDDPHAIRQGVERFLLTHPHTNGGGLYRAGTEPENATASHEELEREAGCIAAITNPSDGTMVLCRQLPIVREGLCLEHAARFLGVGPDDEPEPETAEDKDKVEVA